MYLPLYSKLLNLYGQYQSIHKPSVHSEMVTPFIWRGGSTLITSIILLNYILLIKLLQLSQFFPLWPPLCSCPWVMHINSLSTPFPVLYFTVPWLFCNYLFVLLNPLTSSPIPPHPLPGNHQNNLCIRYAVSVLLVCLVCFCFLCSIVDSCEFVVILLFIVLVFLLDKSL